MLAGAFYMLPLLLGQGSSLVSVASAMTNGRYRGSGRSPVNIVDITLDLNLTTSPKLVVLTTPMVGRLQLDGQVMPESTGTYLCGTLVSEQGIPMGKLNAHVAPTSVTGTAGIGSLPWHLNLWR